MIKNGNFTFYHLLFMFCKTQANQSCNVIMYYKIKLLRKNIHFEESFFLFVILCSTFTSMSIWFESLNLFELVSNCFNLFQLVSTCFNLFQLVSTCFNLFQLVSTCFNLFQLVCLYFTFKHFKNKTFNRLTVFVQCC